MCRTRFLVTGILVLASLPVAHASPPTLAAALHEADELLRTAPSSSDALHRLLENAHLIGGLNALIAHYQERSRTATEPALEHLLLGHLYRQSGACEDALPQYERAASLHPRSPHPHRGAALCHHQDRRWADSAEAYQRAVARTSSRSNRQVLLESLIQAALRAERNDWVEEAYRRLVEGARGDPTVRVEHARALSAAGRPQMASKVWRDIYRWARRDPKIRILAARELSALLARLGSSEEAFALLHSELGRLPAEHWARPELEDGLIELYRAEGRLHEYVAELERQRPNYPRRLLLARLYEETGQDDRAIEAYREAVQARPANGLARTALLQLLQRTGSRSNRIVEYEQLYRLLPSDTDIPLELARLYFAVGRSEPALALLERVRRRSGADPVVRESILTLLVQHGADPERIEREYRALIQMEPDEPEHLIQLGEFFFAKDALDEALITWRRLIRVYPRVGEAHWRLAQILADHDLNDEATEHYQAAIQSQPNRLRYRRQYALFLEQIDRLDAALDVWRGLLRALPPTEQRKIREAQEKMVVLLLDEQSKTTGELGPQLEAQRQAFDQTPPDLAAGILVALAYIHLRDFEKARTVLEALVQHDARHAQGLALLEEVYSRLHRLADSVRILQILGEIDPVTARERLRQMAELSLQTHRSEDALQFAKVVVNLSPTDAEAQAHLGDVLLQINALQDAEVAYQKSLNYAPNNVQVRLRLCTVLERLSRTEALIDQLKEIIRRAQDPADLLRLNRYVRLLPSWEALKELEEAFLEAVYRNPGKTVYRKILVQFYGALVRHTPAPHGSPNESTTSANPLRSIGNRGLKPLLDALGDADLSVRTEVVRLLVHLRAPNAEAALTRLLSEPDRVLRIQSLIALAHLGEHAGSQAIQGLLEQPPQGLKQSAIWALGAMAPEASGPTLRTQARARFREFTLPQTIALALGAQHSPNNLEAAQHLFLQGAQAYRPHAAWALGTSADPRAAEVLMRRLPIETLEVQAAIIWSLGRIAAPESIVPLLRIAWTGALPLLPVTRWAIERCLHPQVGTTPNLRDRYLQLHDFAQARLDLNNAFPALTPFTDPGAVDGRKLLATHGEEVYRTLLAQLETGDARSRAGLLNTLTPKQGAGALLLGPIAANVQLPVEWHTELRARAVEWSQDTAPSVRAAALGMLGALGGEAPNTALREALNDPEAVVQLAAVQAMGRSGQTTFVGPLLAQTLQNPPWTLRLAITRALLPLLQQEPQKHAAAVEPLGRLLGDAYPSVQLSALLTIQALGATAAPLTEAILELTDTLPIEMAPAAVQTLAAIGSVRAREGIRALRAHPNPAIRRVARDVLPSSR